MVYAIEERDLNKVIRVLQEIPAKYSYESISILRSLKPILEQKDKE